jgi:hypothetical protein
MPPKGSKKTPCPVRTEAHPFMVPAVDETRPTVRAIGQAALKDL